MSDALFSSLSKKQAIILQSLLPYTTRVRQTGVLRYQVSIFIASCLQNKNVDTSSILRGLHYTSNEMEMMSRHRLWCLDVRVILWWIVPIARLNKSQCGGRWATHRMSDCTTISHSPMARGWSEYRVFSFSTFSWLVDHEFVSVAPRLPSIREAKWTLEYLSGVSGELPSER